MITRREERKIPVVWESVDNASDAVSVGREGTRGQWRGAHSRALFTWSLQVTRSPSGLPGFQFGSEMERAGVTEGR